MGSLILNAAINFGIGLALNALFPPEEINQEGPRLNDLDVTSSTYGKMVKIPFGTARLGGNIIWAEEIEEVKNTQSVGGKGGGPSGSSTTYTYFATLDVSLGISGADTILRLWGDGKLIFDNSVPADEIIDESGINSDDVSILTLFISNTELKGIEFTLYPGGDDQLSDPLEEADFPADTPAYRHLSRIVFDRMPLADFGNRIPNITAEVTYRPTNTGTPHIRMNEHGATDVPGSALGAENYTFYAPEIDSFLSLKNTATGIWRASGTTLQFQNHIHSGGIDPDMSCKIVGAPYVMHSEGASNNSAVIKDDVMSGEELSRGGSSSSFLTDSAGGVWNLGIFAGCRIQHPVFGARDYMIHVGGLSGDVSKTSYWDVTGTPSFIRNIAAGLIEKGAAGDVVIIPLPNTDSFTGPEFQLGAFLIISIAQSATEHLVTRVDFDITSGANQVLNTRVLETVLSPIPAGVGDGSGFVETVGVTGWAVDEKAEKVLLSLGTVNGEILLYDYINGTVDKHTQANNARVMSRSMYTTRNRIIATKVVGQGESYYYIVDTRDLSMTEFPFEDIGLDGNSIFNETSLSLDDERGAFFLSRVSAGIVSVVSPHRIVKIFFERNQAVPIPLSSIITGLTTSYQGLTTGGLVNADIDVSEHTATNVFGFTINRQGTIRDSLNILRNAYFFDGVESDFILKFPGRGQASVLTIPEEQVGEASETGDFVREIRQQEVELPMRLGIRYINYKMDYAADVELSKRIEKPNKTMFSLDEKTMDIPIVFVSPDEPKQLTEKWLFTTWNERRQFETILPWTYLKLDPTDVFKIGVSGETLQLRLADQDIGLSYAMDIRGVREDAFSFASTLKGSGALGFINQNIVGTLITKLINLDSPLLRAGDLQFSGVTSNGYAAMGGISSALGWEGGELWRSTELVEGYISQGNQNVGMSWAIVISVPSAIVVDQNEGEDFPNTFQEVADGGSFSINIITREDDWSSSTELNVLNGGNGLAIVTANGVEILQFQDFVDNGDNTWSLQRLLRGRLGTEKRAIDGDIAIGDEIVLLSLSDGTTLDNNVLKTHIPLAELNTQFFYKPVTFRNLLEETASQSFIYTGRDLIPYSVCHLGADISPVNGDFTIDWERRTRVNGAWLDGIGSVPLNEIIEQYAVELFDTAGVSIATSTVNNVTTETFSQEITDSLLAVADRTSMGLLNGTFEVDVDDWEVMEAGSFVRQGFPAFGVAADHNGVTSTFCLRFNDSLSSTTKRLGVRQDIDVSSIDLSIPRRFILAGYLTNNDTQHRSAMALRLRAYDGDPEAGGNLLQSYFGDERNTTIGIWYHYVNTGILHPATKWVRIELSSWWGNNFSFPNEVDDLIVTAATTGHGTQWDDITLDILGESDRYKITVRQNSDTASFQSDILTALFQ